MWLFAAISSGPMSLAVPIVMSYPATTVIVVAAIGRVPGLLQLVLVAIIMTGVLVVAASEAADDVQSHGSERRRRTIGFALLSHVTFLFAVLAGQQAALTFGEIESVWISRIAGTLVVLPMLLGGGGKQSITLPLWALLAFMGALDVAALSLLFAAGHTPQPELAVVCASASGAVTVILAWLFAKERIVPLRWAGIAMTFAGIAALSAVK
jgi:drug/metabolite transporter (DMT)-like permease